MINRIALIVALALFVGCNTIAAPKPQPTQAPRINLANPASMPPAISIPLTTRGGYLFASGEVNGTRAGVMLIDTGSTLTIVDTGLANRLHLPITDQGRTTGIAGEATFDFREVESIALSGVGIGVDRIASLSMRRFMSGVGLSPGGLIGFNALDDHPFTIDYQALEIIVYRRDRFTPPPGALRVELMSFRGLPAVVATLAGGQEVLLILDTGADNTLSLPLQVARWPRVMATGQTGAGHARGVGGTIETQSGWLKHIDVFGLQLAGIPVTFEPTPPGLSSRRYAVGRIGGKLLKSFRITYDMPTRSLWVEFRPDGEE